MPKHAAQAATNNRVDVCLAKAKKDPHRCSAKQTEDQPQMNDDPQTSDDAIVLLTTGGTIDKVYFDSLSEFQVGETVVDKLLRDAHVEAPYRLVELLRKDSLEITDQDRHNIVAAVEQCPESRIVITHGTDTMAKTAEALLACAGKTIVLTGALAPARFAQSDATFNVGMAFAAVQTAAPGAYIVMNGQVFTAGRVRKDRSRNAFVHIDASTP